VLPPACWTAQIRQIGEPNDHIRGRATFATLHHPPEHRKRWVFAGYCFRNEFVEAK
jgi:hypothetical protein